MNAKATIEAPTAPTGSGGAPANPRSTLWLSMAIVAWAMAVAFGWWTVSAYEFRRERAEFAAAVGSWPVESRLTLASDRPTMLFFMHPKCPCTRASLAEMERLWTVRQRRGADRAPKLIVVVTVPEDAADDWINTDTVSRARALAGALFAVDREGHEARRFGVATSGAVKWFDRSGQCLYSGGITGSRGHEGGNVGSDAVERLLLGATEPIAGLPPFGCRLCLPPSGGMP